MSITGDFSSILHGASLWNGQRLAIVFYLNKKILDLSGTSKIENINKEDLDVSSDNNECN